jgi:hypothetical protein
MALSSNASTTKRKKKKETSMKGSGSGSLQYLRESSIEPFLGAGSLERVASRMSD